MQSVSNVLKYGRRPLAVLAGVAVLVGAFLVGLPTGSPPPAYAYCQVPNGVCNGFDPTKTAAVTVRHIRSNGTTWVEPTSETWAVTGDWGPTGGAPCDPYNEVAYVTVTWNGTTPWVLSNQTLTNEIVGFSICDLSGGCGTAAGPRAYMLMANVNDPAGPGGLLNLHHVDFATTAVGNGTEFNMLTCLTNGTTRTPTSQVFSGTDNGAFECSFSCGNVTAGASIDIVYN